jgi:UDP-3-O-[3-hydroxymyristoyl] glucosamine N-acyltransferase
MSTHNTHVSEDASFTEFAYAAGVRDDMKPAIVRGTFAFIHPTARIGARTVIFPLAYIGPRVSIGEDCVIGPGAAIGQPGFGYDEQEDGSWAYKPHEFGVKIADDVHIGANACVDGGRYRDTVIGNGSRIDDLAFIAHNVQIGHDCLVIANAMIAGSCEIGNGVIVGPSASLRDHVTVGDRAMIGLGAVVVKNIPPGEVWAGNPAKFMRPRGDELR